MMKIFQRRLVRRLVGAAVLLGSVATLGAAQDLVVATRGPRFLMASRSPAPPVEIDVRTNQLLRRRVSLEVHAASLRDVLRTLSAQAGVKFLFDPDVVPVDRPVTLRADGITLAGALLEILMDTDLDVLLMPSARQLALVKRTSKEPVPHAGAIVGQVTDSATGYAVAGAEVFLDNTRWRTTADTAGRYALTEIDTGTYTLVVRHLGYAKQSRSVAIATGRIDTVNVVLKPVATRLNELVSTATGMRRRMDIANDVTTINADSVMQTAPITTLTDLLEGRVPGLTVQHTSGAPGDPARLRLRGAGSPLHSNDPIVFVDGVRVYAEQSAARSANLASRVMPSTNAFTDGQGAHPGDTTSNAVYAAPSPLDYIDPNTIETIEVFKGPSAATLYGPDAANGVIVITTKRGKAGPTKWSFGAVHGQNRAPGAFPDVAIRWGHPRGVNDTPIFCTRRDLTCDADSVVTYQFLNDPSLTVLDRGARNSLSLTASGGTNSLTYSITGSYGKDVGLFKLPGYEVDRYQSLHGGQTPPDWMQRPENLTKWGVSSKLAARLGATADVSLSSQLSRTLQQKSSLDAQVGQLMTTYFDRASGAYYQVSAVGTGNNIVNTSGSALEAYYQRARAGATEFRNGLNLTWRPKPWLDVNGDAGLDIQRRDDEVYLPAGAGRVTTSIFDTAGALATGQGGAVTGTLSLRGTAKVPLGLGFRLNVTAGTDYKDQSISDLGLSTTGLSEGTSLLGTTVNGKSRSLQDISTFGWYLEPVINHRRFSLSTGFRVDGSSNYGTQASTSLSGGLPKLGFTYLLSDEPFFPFKDLFQSFLVRMSYGRATRQPGVTDRLRLYTPTGSDWVDGGLTNVITLNDLGNTELRPERSSEFEGGFAADLLDSRLSMDVTLYRKTTDDAIMNFPLPPSVYGAGVHISKNIGVIRNTGVEVTASAQLIRSGPVTFTSQLAVQRNRSVVVKLGPGVDPFYAQLDNSSGASGLRVAPGYPLFGRWSKPILGYADANGDGVLQESEVAIGDTAVYVGTSVPNYQADLTGTLGLWRGAVTVNAQLHYDDGFTQMNSLAYHLAPFSPELNSGTSTLAEQAAVIPLATTPYNWFQTVHVLRFQSLSVGYRVPTPVARRLGAQGLSVSVQGGNLGIWSNYRGLDPNVNTFATGNAGVSDNGVLPQLRVWQVQINATY